MVYIYGNLRLYKKGLKKNNRRNNDGNNNGDGNNNSDGNNNRDGGDNNNVNVDDDDEIFGLEVNITDLTNEG